MINHWELDFWKSDEWKVCEERLNKLEANHVRLSPRASERWNSFVRTPNPMAVKCAIFGQDPYPDPKYATGVAFSIPKTFGGQFPPTLQTIFREYSTDLHRSVPSHGDLSRWIDQGVFLWNAVPSTQAGASLAHDWSEWRVLNQEIIKRLSTKGIVFVLVGAVARRYLEDVLAHRVNECICVGHPSPRGNLSAKVPFTGSRLFSSINEKLTSHGLPAIDWSLDEPAKG